MGSGTVYFFFHWEKLKKGMGHWSCEPQPKKLEWTGIWAKSRVRNEIYMTVLASAVKSNAKISLNNLKSWELTVTLCSNVLMKHFKFNTFDAKLFNFQQHLSVESFLGQIIQREQK